jgi:hypothetical protein
MYKPKITFYSIEEADGHSTAVLVKEMNFDKDISGQVQAALHAPHVGDEVIFEGAETYVVGTVRRSYIGGILYIRVFMKKTEE